MSTRGTNRRLYQVGNNSVYALVAARVNYCGRNHSRVLLITPTAQAAVHTVVPGKHYKEH